jgi:hypothetical protein
MADATAALHTHLHRLGLKQRVDNPATFVMISPPSIGISPLSGTRKAGAKYLTRLLRFCISLTP